MFREALEGSLIGIIAAITVIYGFQTRTPYPDVVIHSMIEHPAIFVGIVVLTLAFFKTSPVIMSMLFLLECALILDVMMFRNPLSKTQPIHVQGLKQGPLEISQKQSETLVPNDVFLSYVHENPTGTKWGDGMAISRNITSDAVAHAQAQPEPTQKYFDRYALI